LSRDGINVIDPRHLPFNNLPPLVHIEQITADRKKHETSSNLRLPALTRDLEIDYTALSLVAPEKIRFRVKLEGRDPDWKDVGNERKAFYNDLPPRNYRFRVAASNNSGVWNEAGASFDFSIRPAYYQTTWFQASSAAAFFLMLWGLYRYRLHQIAQRFNTRMEARVDERTRIARELHDTLLQSFQALMIHFQAVDNLLPPGKGKDALEKVLDRADRALVEGRNAIQNIRSSTTVTNELSNAVTALGEELAGSHDGETGPATFRVSVEGTPRDLRPILRDDIYRIAREALQNAFRHAQASQIEADITYGDSLLRLRVRDDGKGIDPKHLQAGRDGHWGLPGMRERAQQIGAQFEMWSEVGAGTEVELRIPGSIVYEKARGRGGLFRNKHGLFRKKKEGSNER
jgi:signal transduction histidine kinase